MQIFSPVAWRLENARLILIARRGHDLPLINTNGIWKKEKPSGEGLELRRRN